MKRLFIFLTWAAALLVFFGVMFSIPGLLHGQAYQESPRSRSGHQVRLIYFCNRTTYIPFTNEKYMSGVQLQGIVDALQIQIDRDFSRVWHTTAHLVVSETPQPPAGEWNLVIGPYDPSNPNDVLVANVPYLAGYHTLGPDGVPTAKIFIHMAYDLGRIISHETLEMLIDPYVTRRSPDSKSFL